MLGIACVVGQRQFDSLPEDAARCIDVSDRQFGTDFMCPRATPTPVSGLSGLADLDVGISTILQRPAFSSRLSSNYTRVWESRELLRSLVERNLKVKYKRSVLGFVWTLFHPLLLVGVIGGQHRDYLIKQLRSLGKVLAAMIPFFVLGVDGQVSVKYLAMMVCGGMVVVAAVQSIMTLEQYGWRDKDYE